MKRRVNLTPADRTVTTVRRSQAATSKPTTLPKQPIPELIEAFLEHCRDKKLSPKTIDWAYGWPLRKLLAPYCSRNGIRTLRDLDEPAVGRFARSLHQRNLAVASVRSYLKGVNTFLNWARKNGPTSPLPSLKKVERDVLTLREMRKLEAVAPMSRDQLIIRILADTGMRESELVTMTLDDVLERDGKDVLRIRGKTGQRMPSISPEVRDRLRRYTSHERPRDATSRRIFVAHARHAKTRVHEPLTGSGIYQMVKNQAARLGWGKRVYVHLLRHSNITLRMVRQQSPAEIVAETGVSIKVLVENYSHPALKDRHASTMLVLDEALED